MPNPVSRLLHGAKRATSRSLAAEENRRYHRASFPPLEITVQGFRARARNWSAGGAAVAADGLDLAVGALIQGEAGWLSSSARYPFYADVVRRIGEGRFALRWLRLDPAFLAELDDAAHAGEPQER